METRMPTKVVMEALSPTMEEGRLVEWKKQEGDPVSVGDVLAEVETDKAVMELVARAGGTLLKHVVEAGATVPVSETVAVIGEPGEETGGEAGTRQAGDGKKQRSPEQPRDGKTARQESQGTQPAPDRNQPTSMPPAPPGRAASETRAATEAATSPTRELSQSPIASPTPPGARVKASPLARRIAAERGLDLGGVAGSGPEGRIV